MTNTDPPLALLRALFDVQRQIKPVPKASEMDAGKFGYSYASSADVVRYARAELATHGLMVTFNKTSVYQFEGARGTVEVAGCVFHEPSGETIQVSFALPYIGTKGRPDDKASQASVTTAEARAYRLLLGLTTSDEEEEVASYVEQTEPAARTSSPPKESKPTPAEPPPPKPAAPPAPDAEAKAEREAIQSVEREEEQTNTTGPDRSPASDEEIGRFKEAARRLGLDVDSATAFASRPSGAKISGNPAASIFAFSDAVERGAVAALADALEADIAGFKAKKVNPRKQVNKQGKTWPEAVKAWAANQINF